MQHVENCRYVWRDPSSRRIRRTSASSVKYEGHAKSELRLALTFPHKGIPAPCQHFYHLGKVENQVIRVMQGACFFFFVSVCKGLEVRHIPTTKCYHTDEKVNRHSALSTYWYPAFTIEVLRLLSACPSLCISSRETGARMPMLIVHQELLTHRRVTNCPQFRTGLLQVYVD